METKKGKLGSATAGGAVGTVAGVSGSSAAVSASGSVAGLSASGFTSGLAAIGGGSMIVGSAILMVGTVILAGGGAYGGYKIYKYFANKKCSNGLINIRIDLPSSTNQLPNSPKVRKSRRRF